MARRDETATGITQRTKVQKDVWADTAGNVVDQAGNVIISAAAQALVSQAGKLVPTAKRRNISSRGITFEVLAGSNNSAAPGWTSHVRQTADAPFTHIRLLIPNFETVALTGCTGIVAATANTTSNITPTGAWATVTVAGSATFTLPARVSATEPSLTVTDWIRVDSIARNDGGTLPLAMGRVFTPSANATFSLTSQLTGGFDAVSGGRLCWLSRMNVDGVTTPASYNSTGEGSTSVFTGMQFRSLNACSTVLGVGDSITGGYRATYTANNWGHQAQVLLSNAGKSVSWINGGWVGQTTAAFIARGKSMVTALSPQIVVFSPFSPNDGTPSASTIATQMAQLMDWLDFCSINEVVPVITTPAPNVNYNSTQDAFRKTFRDQIKALGDSGLVDVCDFDAVLSDQAAAARYISGLANADGVHPSDAGYAAMAAAMAATLTTVLARIQ